MTLSPPPVPADPTTSRRRGARLLLVVVAVVASWMLSPGRAEATACAVATISWDGGAGTTAWTDAANWDQNRVPEPTDHVCIEAAATGDSVTLNGTATALSLGAHKPLTVMNGTLTLGSPDHVSQITDGLDLRSTIAGDSPLTLGGPVIWSSGTFAGPGVTTVPSGVTVAVTGTLSKSLGGPLVNDGTIRVEGTGTISFASDGVLTNNGVIDLAADATLSNSTGGRVVNMPGGRITKSAGVTSIISALVENDGLIESTTGLLELRGGTPSGATSSGTMQATGTARVELDSGTYRMASGATVTGTGRTLITGGTVVGPLTVAADATLRWEGGTFTGADGIDVAATATLEMAGGTKTLATEIRNAGTVSVTGTGVLSFSSDSSVPSVASIVNTGAIDLAGDATFNVSSTASNGVTNAASGTITKSAGATSLIVTPVQNHGTISPAVGTIDLDGMSVGSTGALAPAAGARVLISPDFETFKVGPGATIDGPGTVQLVAGTLVGPLTVTTGATLELAGGTWEGPASGFATVQSGATVRVPTSTASRYVTGRIRNLGTFAIPGNLRFSDDATLQNEGTIEMKGSGVIDCCFGSSTGVKRILNRAAGVITHTGTATSTAMIEVPLDNDGVTTSTAGTLDLAGGNPPGQGSVGTYAPAAGATLRFTAGTHLLGVGSTITGPGTPVVTGGAVLGRGRVAAGTTLSLQGGTLGGHAAGRYSLTVEPGATVTVDTGTTVAYLGYQIRNEGVIRLARTVNLNADTVLTNAGTVEVADAGALGGTVGQGQLLNLRRSTVTHTGAPSSVGLVRALLANYGTVTSDTGELQLHGGTPSGRSSDGKYSAATDAVLSLRAGTHLMNGGRFFGPGTVEMRGGKLDGTWILTKTTRFDLWGGELAGGTEEAPNLIVSGAFLRVPGITGLMSGLVINEGTVSVPNAGQLLINDFAVLRNVSRIEVEGSGEIDIPNTSTTHGRIENTLSGEIVRPSGTTMTGVSQIRTWLDNDGFVEAQAGELSLAGGTGDGHGSSGVYSAAPGARLTMSNRGNSTYWAHVIEPGGRFSGTGEIVVTGEIKGPWTVDPGTTLRVESTMSQMRGGTADQPARISPGARLLVPDTALTTEMYLSGVLRNEGEIRIDGTLSLGSGEIVNAETIALGGNGSVVYTAGFFGPRILTNEPGAVVAKVDGPATAGTIAVPLDNDGIVRSDAGELRLTEGSGANGQTSSGEYTSGSDGSVVTFAGRDHRIAPGGRITGAARLETGTASALSGPVLIDDGGSLEIRGGEFLAPKSGTGEAVIGPAGEVHHVSAAKVEGAIRNEGLMRVTADQTGYVGTITNNATLELGDGAYTGGKPFTTRDFRIINNQSGTVHVTDGTATIPDRLENLGTVIVDPDAWLRMARATGFDTSTKTLRGGTWRIAGRVTVQSTYTGSGGHPVVVLDTDFELSGPQAAIVLGDGSDVTGSLTTNRGTFRITDRALTLGAFTNHGEMVVGPGAALSVPTFTQRAGSLDVDPTASITATDPVGFVLDGGEMRGSGSIVGTLTNTGAAPPVRLAPGGELDVGDYVQQVAGIFHVELSDAGTEAVQRQLLGTGTGTLAGTLRVRTTDSFVPVFGDSYVLGTFASRIGQFTALDLDEFEGFALQPFYTPTEFGVTVVAAP